MNRAMTDGEILAMVPNGAGEATAIRRGHVVQTFGKRPGYHGYPHAWNNIFAIMDKGDAVHAVRLVRTNRQHLGQSYRVATADGSIVLD